MRRASCGRQVARWVWWMGQAGPGARRPASMLLLVRVGPPLLLPEQRWNPNFSISTAALLLCCSTLQGWSRVMAEHEWLALHDNFGLPVHIFRCGGIYGEAACLKRQRCTGSAGSLADPCCLLSRCTAVQAEAAAPPSPLSPACLPLPCPLCTAGPRRSAIEALQGGRGSGSASADRRGRQRYTARCHVYDICQTLEASMQHPHPGAAYNIADDDPAGRATVMAFASELLQRRAAGLPLAVSPGGGPGGDWGVPTVTSASDSSSSGSFDSGDEVTLLDAAVRPRRQSSSGRMARGEARQAASAVTAAVREELAEKRVGWLAG